MGSRFSGYLDLWAPSVSGSEDTGFLNPRAPGILVGWVRRRQLTCRALRSDLHVVSLNAPMKFKPEYQSVGNVN
jgi:hypothetical protein